MNRRTKQSPNVPEGFALGSAIDISSWHSGELAVDVAGRAHCYLGYMREKQPFDLPYYATSVALHDKGGRASHRFVELRGGMLRKTFFLRDDAPYRILDDKWLVLPRGADSYFGVIDRATRSEDAPLTRQVFGGTKSEIETAAIAFSTVIGRGPYEYARIPRVTFSKTGNNSCDISRCFIPKNFPYLAFANAQYEWSHVSLHGFYRLLAFTCPRSSPLRNALLQSGLPEDVLSVLLNASEEYGEPLKYPEYHDG